MQYGEALLMVAGAYHCAGSVGLRVSAAIVPYRGGYAVDVLCPDHSAGIRIERLIDPEEMQSYILALTPFFAGIN